MTVHTTDTNQYNSYCFALTLAADWRIYYVKLDLF